MSDTVELHSQFSQVTRHDVAVRNSENNPENQAIEHAPIEGNVTLISKYSETCHGPEKIPFITSPDDAWKADCETLSAMDLRRRYRREATCHRNMLSRRKTQGAVVSPLFEEFRSFLKIMGPMPVAGATVDRIDNSDPEYAPDKVRWADKRTQNSNKGDSLTFHYSRTRDTYTTSRLARLQNVSPAAIRKRFERGWSDDEIIEGHKTSEPTMRHRPPSSAACEALDRSAPPKFPSTPQEWARFREEERRKSFESERLKYQRDGIPGEPIPITPQELFDGFDAEEQARFFPAEFDPWGKTPVRNYRERWLLCRKFANYFNMTEHQQEWIKHIDPEWVAAQIEAKKRKGVLLPNF